MNEKVIELAVYADDGKVMYHIQIDADIYKDRKISLDVLLKSALAEYHRTFDEHR